MMADMENHDISHQHIMEVVTACEDEEGMSITPIRALAAPWLSIVEVAAGARHSLVLTAAGTVYSFGSNDFGQLGPRTGELAPRNSPVRSSPGRVRGPSLVAGGLQGVACQRVAAAGSAAVAAAFPTATARA